MTLINSMSNFIAKLPTNTKFDQMMSKVSNPAPGNVAPYLIPETAVITGRSTFSWLRNGFIEFQERFLEETIVAAAWFWGVTWLDNMYKKGWKKWAPGDMKHRDMDVDWGVKKAKGLELNSFERYAFNPKEWAGILKAKSGKLAFAVGGTLFTVAALIPWLNQLKTDWILKNYYKPEHQPKSLENLNSKTRVLSENSVPSNLLNLNSSKNSEASRSAFSNALKPTQNPAWIAPVSNALPPNQNPAWIASPSNALPPNQNPAWIASQQNLPLNSFSNSFLNLTRTVPASAFVPSQPFRAPYTPYFQNTQHPASNNFINSFNSFNKLGAMPAQSVRFGFSGGNSFKVIGHAIENTDVGRMLIIDAGITGGRAVVAGRRSPFESVEIVFRDAVSLYFYILCVPHVTTALNKWVNPKLAASILLDPAVASKITEKIMSNKPLQEALKAGRLSTAQMDGLLERVFYGVLPETTLSKKLAKFPSEEIQQAMRTVKTKNKGGLLEKELSVFFNKKEGLAYNNKIMKYLNHPESLSSNEAMKLLNAIKSGEGPFKGLESDARKKLMTGVKHAFGYNAGISVTEFKQRYQPFITELGEEATPFLKRLDAMAKQDSRDLINKMFRRTINVSRHILGASDKGVQQAEFLSRYIEKATGHNVSIGDVLSEEVKTVLSELKKKKFSLSEIQQAMLGRLESNTPLLKGDLALMDTVIEEAKAFRGGLFNSQKLRKVLPQLKDLKNTMVEGVGTETMVEKRVEQILKSIASVLEKDKSALAPEVRALLLHYKESLADLFLEKNRRIFSLAVDDAGELAPELARKMKELLHGGLMNDSAFLKEALREINALEDDARKFVSETKSKDMLEAMEDYMKTMQKNIHLNKAEEKWTGKSSSEFMAHFYKLSKNSRYIVRWIGLLTAMVGIGFVVPKFQNLLTKHLTGKDEHPGIAVAKAKAGIYDEPNMVMPSPLYSSLSSSGSVLNRNNFNAFKTSFL